MRRIFQITGLLLLLLSFLQPLTSNAQGKLITGTVVSGDNKLPLQGVNISVKGAKTSTATDAQEISRSRRPLVPYLFLLLPPTYPTRLPLARMPPLK